MRDVFARTQFSRRRVLISMIGSAPFAATWRLYRRAVEREARLEPPVEQRRAGGGRRQSSQAVERGASQRRRSEDPCCIRHPVNASLAERN